MSQKKKPIFVTRSSMPPFEEYVETIRPLWDSCWLTNMGTYHEELAKKLADYLGVPFVSLFVNGHMALELCIQAFGLTGEVITTPFTFVSTTHAIIRNGLTPVFADIKEEDFTMDPEKIEGLITDKTTAILPVHVYGNMCDTEAIEEIAKKYGLKVIYDAAHAFGVTKKGRGAGDFGHASMFSFHATKVFHTIEGGAIGTKDKNLVHALWKLKDFGIRDEEVVDGIGANGKMNEFQAAMGLCNLNHVHEEIEKRKNIVLHYRERLKGRKGLFLKEEQQNVCSNYGYFPVIFNPELFGEDRDSVFLRLKSHGIHARKYFYPLTNAMECFQGRFDVQKTPIAKKIGDRVLTLPLFSQLPLEEADRICDILLENG
ncbi:MAG: DegT/DnrJ/EryC1/StrS family aminotransferase [Lachnospiraceae bacterium]|jgi:dTDP-4-amino-4,6-dideoxygalactose transaminase|nr:DegT/DnrJ/EryC1/StrS family aminotransferase [Lachnospiraceae bacterium]